MNTSYFAKYKGKNAVSIAGKTPDGFKGRIYKKLAPHYSWWKIWKDKHSTKEWYTQKYYETVLNKLNAQEIYDDLGEDAVLLCYEKSGEFCHRHIVAEWFKKELGINITELK